MPIGLIVRKCGMTRVFAEDGTSIPVTVMEVKPNWVTQVRTNEKDGYCAVQVTTGERKPSRLNKPEAGHFAKAKVMAGRGLWEFRFTENEEIKLNVGDEVVAKIFTAGQVVDVISNSRGRGFAGAVKRHNFSMQRATHGNSLAHRAPGSIGQNQTPGRVFKGKKMAGQMGNTRVTVQNLEIIRVDEQRGVILIKGAVPGAPGTDVIVRPACKRINCAADVA